MCSQSCSHLRGCLYNSENPWAQQHHLALTYFSDSSLYQYLNGGSHWILCQPDQASKTEPWLFHLLLNDWGDNDWLLDQSGQVGKKSSDYCPLSMMHDIVHLRIFEGACSNERQQWLNCKRMSMSCADTDGESLSSWWHTLNTMHAISLCAQKSSLLICIV